MKEATPSLAAANEIIMDAAELDGIFSFKEQPRATL